MTRRPMRMTKEMHFASTGELIGRYPWADLEEIGDVIELHGELLSPLNAQLSAHAYGKRHGVKISTKRTGKHSIACCRVA